jgi:sulfate adenylyltransferase
MATAIVLDARQHNELELLLSGAYAPLTTYMTAVQHHNVLHTMSLTDTHAWTIPLTLQLPAGTVAPQPGSTTLKLVNTDNVPLAFLDVSETFTVNLHDECDIVLGTTNADHPYVAYLDDRWPGPTVVCVSGLLVPAPNHNPAADRLPPLSAATPTPFAHLHATPAQTAEHFRTAGWDRVVGFQTRNPLHNAHVAVIRAAVDAASDGPGSSTSGPAALLLHPTVGVTQDDDVPVHVRTACHAALAALPTRPLGDRVHLATLPLPMRMAGPREAVMHAIVRRNHGCTHFVVGRDHAGTVDSAGRPFYAPDAAVDLCGRLAGRLPGITIVTSAAVAFSEVTGGFATATGVKDAVAVQEAVLDRRQAQLLAGSEDGMPPDNTRILLQDLLDDRADLHAAAAAAPRSVSGTALRAALVAGDAATLDGLAEWFSPPVVLDILRRFFATAVATARAGACVYFVGLSGSGKTHLACALRTRLLERGDTRPVTLLDGDEVRTHLSRGLGFSAADRSANVRRIGFVAAEVVRAGGLAVVANIAPFAADRAANTAAINAAGANGVPLIARTVGSRCLTVFVDTPLAVCEARDVKGLYAKARAGTLPDFTGISSPFESPDPAPDTLIVDGSVEDDIKPITDSVVNRLALLAQTA